MKTIHRLSILTILALMIFPASAFLSGQQETPRMKCLKRVQAEHIQCLSNAKGDEQKKSACNKKQADDLKLCPAPSSAQ